MSTFWSYEKAPTSAPGSSSLERANLTPRAEPWLAGLTTRGNPSALSMSDSSAAAPSSLIDSSRTEWKSGVGTPASRIRYLARTLSVQRDERRIGPCSLQLRDKFGAHVERDHLVPEPGERLLGVRARTQRHLALERAPALEHCHLARIVHLRAVFTDRAAGGPVPGPGGGAAPRHRPAERPRGRVGWPARARPWQWARGPALGRSHGRPSANPTACPAA